MKKNIGRLDQILRIGISLLLIYMGFIDVAFISDPLSSNIVGVLGILNLIVAIVQNCPLYSITGINTCQKKN